jgi:hypothetical protein
MTTIPAQKFGRIFLFSSGRGNKNSRELAFTAGV